MQIWKLGLLCSLLWLSLTGAASDVGSVVDVLEAYIPEMAPAQANAVVFARLRNRDAVAHQLIKVECALSKKAELHQSSVSGGTARMQRIEALPLAAGAEVRLASGGAHVMLMGVARRLTSGERVSVVLGFEDGSRKLLEVEVRPLAR